MITLEKSPFKTSDTLVIGLGGHKCASTWLYDYFSWHPECFTSHVKELNFFKNQHTLNTAWLIKNNARKVMDEVKSFTNDHPDFDFISDEAQNEIEYRKMSARVQDFAANLRSLSLGGNYWDNFSRKENIHTHVVDISPSYCLSSPETLDVMQNAHKKTRFFYIMRDPAERAFSAFKFSYKRNKKKLGVRPRVRFKQLQLFLSENPVVDAQCDYLQNLQNIDGTLNPKHIYIGFYEALFNDDSMKALCDVLNLDFIPPRYDRHVNKTDDDDNKVEMNKYERAFLVERYYDVYKGINERFGDKAPDDWNWPSDILKMRQ